MSYNFSKKDGSVLKGSALEVRGFVGPEGEDEGLGDGRRPKRKALQKLGPERRDNASARTKEEAREHESKTKREKERARTRNTVKRERKKRNKRRMPQCNLSY
jgi:hypothetical protein